MPSSHSYLTGEHRVSRHWCWGSSFEKRPSLIQSTPKRTAVFIYLTLAVSFITYARFCSLVIRDITEFLGIACFTVRKKDGEGVWRETRDIQQDGYVKRLWFEWLRIGTWSAFLVDTVARTVRSIALDSLIDPPSTIFWIWLWVCNNNSDTTDRRNNHHVMYCARYDKQYYLVRPSLLVLPCQGPWHPHPELDTQPDVSFSLSTDFAQLSWLHGTNSQQAHLRGWLWHVHACTEQVNGLGCCNDSCVVCHKRTRWRC